MGHLPIPACRRLSSARCAATNRADDSRDQIRDWPGAIDGRGRSAPTDLAPCNTSPYRLPCVDIWAHQWQSRIIHASYLADVSPTAIAGGGIRPADPVR